MLLLLCSSIVFLAGFVVCTTGQTAHLLDQVMTRVDIIHDYVLMAIDVPITEGLIVNRQSVKWIFFFFKGVREDKCLI